MTEAANDLGIKHRWINTLKSKLAEQ